MLYQVTVPDLGEGIEEVVVSKMLRELQDTIEEDDNLVEVDTDKTTIEIPAAVSGEIIKIHCKEQDVLRVGDVILEINDTPDVASNDDYAQHVATARQKRLVEHMASSEQVVIPASITMLLPWDDLEQARSRLRDQGLRVGRPEIICLALAESLNTHEQFNTFYSAEGIPRRNTTPTLGLAVALKNGDLSYANTQLASGAQPAKFFETLKHNIATIRAGIIGASIEKPSIYLSYMAHHGVINADPVIVLPAIATLFVGAPYQQGDKQTCNLTLTFDHGIINGVNAAKFLKSVIKNISRI